jgi:ribose transport system substrate-binding protein
MLNMKRVIGQAGLVAALLLGMGLAACDNKTPAPAPKPVVTPTTPATKPAETKPAETKPADAAKPADAKPADTKRAAATPAASTKKKFVFGVIAKSENNPVFQAAKTGAFDAGKELGKERGVEIEINWRTPPTEDAQKQAQAIADLVNVGVDGIAVSVTDANVLTAAINAAVDKGVQVVTFDSDAPASKRMATYGMDDVDAGKILAQQLVATMGEKGSVAILAGNQNATNLQARVRGVREELAKHKGITIKETYYHVETADAAVQKIKQVQTANPDITGWAFVGGWPLYTEKALAGVSDKGVTVVSIDTLPLPLAYVQRGEVKALVGQNYYGWGYESVRMLLDYAQTGKKPAETAVRAKVDIVKKENAEEFGKIWDKWLGREKK